MTDTMYKPDSLVVEERADDHAAQAARPIARRGLRVLTAVAVLAAGGIAGLAWNGARTTAEVTATVPAGWAAGMVDYYDRLSNAGVAQGEAAKQEALLAESARREAVVAYWTEARLGSVADGARWDAVVASLRRA